MPCRCDYMEPTVQEIKTAIVSKIRDLNSWDFSKLEKFLLANGIREDEIRQAIEGYKDMMLNGISSGESIKPGLLEDKVLHAHLLHTNDFKEFKRKILGNFNHMPEIDYMPSATSRDVQLLEYCKYANCDSRAIADNHVYKSGILEDDWGFLVEYLCSDECTHFNGTAEDAQKLVFDYLTAVVRDSTGSKLIENAGIRVVLESHILFTENFAEFSAIYLDSRFAYEPE